MVRAAIARRCVVDRAGLRLRQLDEFGRALRRHRGMDHQHERHRADERDGREILRSVVRQLAKRLGLAPSAMLVSRNVVPSGADFATASVPTCVAPPPRFSITIAWPRFAASAGCSARATMSFAPPGG